MTNKCFYIILIIIYPRFLFGQYNSPIHFNQKNGLKSQDMYDCVIDKNGFVWFATEAGPARFNGKEFEYFSMKNENQGDVFLSFAVDSKNRVWANSFSGEIYCFVKGEWIKNNKLKYKLRSDANLYCLDSALYVFSNYILYKFELNVLNITEERIMLDLSNLKKDIRYFSFKNAQFIYNKNTKHAFNLKTLKNETLNQSLKYFLINYNRKLLYINSKYNFIEINLNIDVTKYKFYKNELFICSNQGFYIYERKNDSSFILKENLSKTPCLDVEIDKNDNLWVSTVYEGVYFFPKKIGEVYTYSDLKGDNFIKTVKCKDNFIHLTNFGKVIASKNENFKLLINSNQVAYDLQVYKNDYYFLTHNNFYKNNYKYEDKNDWLKSFMIDSTNQQIYLGYGNGLSKLHTQNERLIYDPNNPNRIYSIIKYENKVLLGSEKGVFVYNNNKMQPYDLGRYSTIKNINKMTLGIDSTLFLLVKNTGVLLKNKNEYLLLNQNQELNNTPTCIYSPAPRTLLVGTKNGINYIKYSINPLKITFIKSFTIYNGLVEDNINNIEKGNNNNEFLVTYNKAFQIINFEKLNQIQSNYKLYFKSISSNIRSFTNVDNIKFNYKENDIEIEFNAIDYNLETVLGYQYRLNNNWTTTNSSIVRFSDLKPGNYTFELKLNSQTKLNNEIIKLNFTIIPAFWQTTWFKLLILIIGIFLILFLIKYYINRIKEKEKEKTLISKQFAELKLEAVRAQMEPHFIFNCLNAIQHYNIKEDYQSAQYFMSEFAKLIRKTLNHSKKDFIALNEEIELLEIYIKLEKLRFEELFDYQIQISDEVKSSIMNYKVPTLIFQPYIENAINHGIKYLKGTKGILTLDFHMENNRLQVIIEDNGIGILKSKKENLGKKHISLGMELNESHIEVINKIHDLDIEYHIDDKSMLNNQTTGTIVSINLPIIKNE